VPAAELFEPRQAARKTATSSRRGSARAAALGRVSRRFWITRMDDPVLGAETEVVAFSRRADGSV